MAGWRGMIEVWPACFTAGFSFAVMQFLVSNYHGPWLVDVISAIVNHLGRNDGSGFVITGPVWEYFADHERMFRPLLRQTPFVDQEAVRFRQQLVSSDLDALLREVALDRANGIQGKTVIHPSHVAAVHALSAVTHEGVELHAILARASSVDGSRL